MQKQKPKLDKVQTIVDKIENIIREKMCEATPTSAEVSSA